MKTQLNLIPGITSAGEVRLFTEMQKILNNNYHSCVYCNTVHQHYVTFFDGNGQRKRREIADLLLISLDQVSKKAKISFLQAKRYKTIRKPLSAPIYSFYGEFGQFFLLKNRPILQSGFPHRTLKFSPAKSLTTYGVFYNDTNGNIDFLYSVADMLNKNSKSNKSGRLELDTNIYGALPLSSSYSYQRGHYKESTAIDGIDSFEKDLITWKIGAVLPSRHKHTFLSYIFKIVLSNLDNQISSSNRNKIPDLFVSRDNLLSLAEHYGINLSDNDRIKCINPFFPFSSVMIIEGNSERQFD